MSRSYRKPYYTIAGGKTSEHNEKKIASRVWRRFIKRSVARADWDSYVIPDRREVGHNDRWIWPGDGGNQLWVFPPRNVLATLLNTEDYEKMRLEYEKLKRK